MRLSTLALCLLTLPCFARQSASDAPAPTAAHSGRVGFDARAAEHLLSRAGFGATEAEVAAAVALGLEATLEQLCAGDPRPREPWTERLVGVRATNRRLQDLPRAERQRENRALRARDRKQLEAWRTWWVGRILDARDPLRERMVLFWHGHFPSAMSDVANGHELVEQNRLFREHALGDARELVRRVARDAAMLEYLDNDENRKQSPNENFARELLELFTLGEGHYGEEDVRAVARSFTGWTDRDGEFRFQKGQHDSGRKTVLGVTDNLGGDEVLAILFESPQFARHLSSKLVAHFEGSAPEGERAERYARLFAAAEFDVEALLRALFRDPQFYRPDAVGARIASPLDFLAGSAHRLGVRPPADWIALASSVLGEKLFEPPTVEGWPGGAAWITTSSLMQRGNLAGILCGALAPADLARTDADAPVDASGAAGTTRDAREASSAASKRALAALGPDLRRLAQSDWRATPNLGRLARAREARLDGQIVRALAAELLAVDLGEDTLTRLARFLREERERLGIEDGALLEQPSAAEPALRRLAHLMLSLPEAQLH